MSRVQAALLLILVAYSSAHEELEGCDVQVDKISQQFCQPKRPDEDFIDRGSRLTFEPTCDFNASTSSSYVLVNITSRWADAPILQYTCQNSNGTTLADYPLVLSIISGTNNDIRIDPDAEVCFFYGCFKDTLNFDNACYVNSTNMAICRKGGPSSTETIRKVPSLSSTSTPSTKMPSPSVMSTLPSSNSSLTTLPSIVMSSKSPMSTIPGSVHQALSSSAEVSVAKTTIVSRAPQETVENLLGSSDLSAGFVIGIIIFGFVLILIVASISILALCYACGATHKKRTKSYPSSEVFSGIEAAYIDHLPNFEMNMAIFEECDIVTICGSLEDSAGIPLQYSIESKENDYVKSSADVESHAKDMVYCAVQNYPQNTIVEVTEEDPEKFVSGITNSIKLSTRTSDGYIENIDTHSSKTTDDVSISTHLIPEDFEDVLTEPEIFSDEESSVCISPALDTRQNGCRSQNSCYTDASSVQLVVSVDRQSTELCDTIPCNDLIRDTDGYIQSEQLINTTGYLRNPTHQPEDSFECTGYIDNPIQYTQPVDNVTPSDANSYIDSPIQYIQTVGNVTPSDANSSTGYFTTDQLSEYQPHHLNSQFLTAKMCPSDVNSDYIDSQIFTDTQPVTDQPSSLAHHQQPCQHKQLYSDNFAHHEYNDEFVEWGSLDSLTSV